MIKLLTITLCSTAIKIDESNKIINTSKGFQNFIGQPFNTLEQALKKQKYHSVKIQDVDE